VKVGANGSGTIDIDLLMATDPVVAVTPLLPWGDGPTSLASFVDGLLAELSQATGIEPEDLRGKGARQRSRHGTFWT
jgi:hypothetical protein